LEVVRILLTPALQAYKRILDLLLILACLPVLAVLLLVIMVLVRLDSAGPVFYTQKRIGFSGRAIRMWKFRSMTTDADDLLKAYLEQDRSLRDEWEENFKLKNDARITRFGGLLRRTSLDELPQIWNVLKGEMSLIGPRPIVDEEVRLYGAEFEIYKQVRPGMTGMWQISGRNDLPYSERVRLDVWYVRNWSIWLDGRILLQTVLVILQGRGAY
jgi:Undecaprenyl-phosphate galactose phosphotransferase WbaP